MCSDKCDTCRPAIDSIYAGEVTRMRKAETKHTNSKKVVSETIQKDFPDTKMAHCTSTLSLVQEPSIKCDIFKDYEDSKLKMLADKVEIVYVFQRFTDEGLHPYPPVFTSLPKRPLNSEIHSASLSFDGSGSVINESHSIISNCLGISEALEPDRRPPIDILNNSKAYAIISDIMESWVEYNEIMQGLELMNGTALHRKYGWAVAMLAKHANKSGQPAEAESAAFIFHSYINDPFDYKYHFIKCDVKYAVPIQNMFPASEELEVELNNGAVEDDFKVSRNHPKVKKTTAKDYTCSKTSWFKSGFIDNQTAHDIKNKNNLEVDRFNEDTASMNYKIRNVTNAVRRISEHHNNLIAETAVAVAQSIIRTKQVGIQRMNCFTQHYDWLVSYETALSKSDIFWTVFCKLNQRTKVHYMDGYLRNYLRPYKGSVGWVRNLTSDGDVEENPGPVSADTIDILKQSLDLEKLVKDLPEVKFPLQHWAHHKLTEHAGLYRDLSYMLIPSYTIQTNTELLESEVPLPLRETQLYPRTIPLARIDGGKIARRNRILDWRLDDNHPGNVLPGIQQLFVPIASGEENQTLYADVNLQPLTPQPIDDEGNLDRLIIWPANYCGQGVSYREIVGRIAGPWRPFNHEQEPELFDKIWQTLDGKCLSQIYYQTTLKVDVHDEYSHRLESGVPVLFICNDVYPDRRVEGLKDSAYTTLIYSKIDKTTTMVPPRSEFLLMGYRRCDVEFYILNVKGVNTDKYVSTWASDIHINLNMTMFNMKLGLLMGWWSLNDLTHQRGVSLAGQPQVTTPWIAPLSRSPYHCVINQSPNNLENCGGQANPSFPFMSVDGQTPAHGTITFHLSMATIAKGDSFLWIPKEWHHPQYMPTIALVVMCLCPYPLGNLGIIMRARDNISQAEADSFHNWAGGLVSMPGDTNINILWPRCKPAVIRKSDPEDTWQGMAMFKPFAGPYAWGGTHPGHEYRVGGDYKHQDPVAGNLIEFVLSWLPALQECDFNNVISYFCEKGVYAKSWHVIFDTIALWATRNSILTVSNDVPIGNFTADDRRRFLDNQDDFVRHIHVYGNTIPKIPADANWLTYRPRSYDGRVGPTLLHGVGAVLGGFSIGSGKVDMHKSALLSRNPSTWIPMSLLAARAIGTAFDAALSYLKISPDNFNHMLDRNSVYSSIYPMLDNFFPSVRIKDPKNMDYIDIILSYATNGAALLPTDTGLNLLRTVTTPRDLSGCIFSRDLGNNFPKIINVKYPDCYFQYVCENILLDWAPIVQSNGGRGIQGLEDPEGQMLEYSNYNHAGPAMNHTIVPQLFNFRDYPILDGISMWNSRVMLLGGHASLVEYRSGKPAGGFIPDGHLVCLFPWAPDEVTTVKPQLSVWLWSNTIFFPTFAWDVRDLFVLNVIPPQQHRAARLIQRGLQSQPFYSWIMENRIPLRLTSNPAERESAMTQKLRNRFTRDRHGTQESSSDIKIDSGNAKRGDAVVESTGAASSLPV